MKRFTPARMVLLLGALAFAGLHFQSALRPALSRSEPIEPDDAYSYILKAEQMRADFFQQGQAWEDLRRQIDAPAQNAQSAYWLNRLEHRLLLIYHPAHSALLAAAHAAGMTWPKAYACVQLLGCAILCLGVAAWLYMIWGPGPAGVGLLLLAPVFFKGQGINQIVPSNFAMGIAFLTWAMALAAGRLANLGTPAGAFAMCAMHPAGRLYSLCAAGFYVWRHGIVGRKRRLVLLVTLAAPLIAGILPLLIARPRFISHTMSGPPEFRWSKGAMANAQELWGCARAVFSPDGMWALIPAAMLIALGLAALAPERRREAAISGLTMGGLTFASILYVLPFYPGAVPERFLIPFVIFLYGAMGQAAWTCASAMGAAKHRTALPLSIHGEGAGGEEEDARLPQPQPPTPSPFIGRGSESLLAGEVEDHRTASPLSMKGEGAGGEEEDARLPQPQPPTPSPFMGRGSESRLAGGVSGSLAPVSKDASSTALRFLLRRPWLACLIATIAVGYGGWSEWRWLGANQIALSTGIKRNAMRLDEEQVKLMLAQSKPDNAALYFDEIPLYFYLSNGAGRRRAIFYSAIRATPAEGPLLRDNPALRFAVFIHPRYRLAQATEDGVFLPKGDGLEIVSEIPRRLGDFQFCFRSALRDNEARIIAEEDRTGKQETETMRVWPSDFGQWDWRPVEQINKELRVRRIVVKAQGNSPGVELRGLRVSAASGLDWPWDERITIRVLSDPPQKRAVAFGCEDLRKMMGRSVRVIQDKGATVLAEIE